MTYKKNALAIAAALISALMLITACGSMNLKSQASPAAGEFTAASSMAPMAPSAMAEDRLAANEMEPIFVTDKSRAESGAISPDRKIVKHSNLTLETKEFDTALELILSAILEQGGYIESQNTNGQSLTHRGAYYERSAAIQARIPADKLDSVTAVVGGIGNVTSKSENIDDITDSYFDSEARLKSLQLQEERLLEILAKAERLEDVISLERALSDVRYQIESLTATLRRMDSQVAYSYLNLSLREVVEYQAVSSAPKTLGEKISASFKRSGEKLVWFFEAVLLFLIEDLPLILIWIAIFGIAAFICFRLFKRTSAKMNQSNIIPASPPAEQPSEPPVEKP